MSYVQRVLQPGEVIRYSGSIHWTVYLPGLVFALLALVTIGYAELGAQGSRIRPVAPINDCVQFGRQLRLAGLFMSERQQGDHGPAGVSRRAGGEVAVAQSRAPYVVQH